MNVYHKSSDINLKCVPLPFPCLALSFIHHLTLYKLLISVRFNSFISKIEIILVLNS